MRWCFIAEDERDNGVSPLLKWIQFLRVKKCSTISCPFSCNARTVSPNNADSEWMDIFTSDLTSVLSNFSGNTIVCNHQECRCSGCKSTCQAAKCLTTSTKSSQMCSFASCKLKITLRTFSLSITHGVEFVLFAYSLFYFASTNTGTSHYTIAFYDGGRRLVYDDRVDQLISYNKRKLSGKSCGYFVAS